MIIITLIIKSDRHNKTISHAYKSGAYVSKPESRYSGNARKGTELYFFRFLAFFQE